LLTAGLLLRPPQEFSFQIQGKPLPAPKWGRVDEIAAFLQAHMKPGDTVQPLDWTGGVLHGMLIAKALPATPYVYDYMFYHHLSRPYIQNLRKKFIASLEKAKPRFIIQVDDDKPWVSGADTSREFKELQQILERYYTVTFKGEYGYVIFERIS
jgi:hypothetical protein